MGQKCSFTFEISLVQVGQQRLLERYTFEETPQNNSVLTAYTPEYSFLSQLLPFIMRRKWHLTPIVLSPRCWQTMPMG